MEPRTAYHHGNLRAALVEAAVRAARAGGEREVRLTPIAGEVGVSPTAAYRHFPGGLDDLLGAVGDVGRAELSQRIRRGTRAVRGTGDAAADARRRFRASGRAYVEYVVDQPGLFQVACRHEGVLPAADRPHTLLEGCLDDLVATGVLPGERRAWASAAAWSAVHGLGLLLTEGALARLGPADRRRAVDRTLDMVERGL